MMEFYHFSLVGEASDPVRNYEIRAFPTNVFGKSQVLSTCSYVYLHSHTQIRARGAKRVKIKNERSKV